MAYPHFPFLFNFKKAVQASALLLSLEDNRMNYMRLLKLLYCADRDSLKETGEPISTDAPFAMERGPVLTHVYDFIKGTHARASEWQGFIKTNNFNVELVNNPGRGALSRYDVDKLSEVSRRYRMDDEWAMVNIVHQFGEWIKNAPGKSCKPIPIEDIFQFAGAAQAGEMVDHAKSQLKLDEQIAQVLA